MPRRAAIPGRSRAAALALALAVAACGTDFEDPAKDAGVDQGGLPDVAFDPGPRDPGAPDPGRDEGPAPDAAPDPAADGGDDPGDDPGRDAGDLPAAAADAGDPGTDAALPNGTVEMSPFTLEFGYVQAGDTARRPLTVRNAGPGDLRVDRFRMTGSIDFAPSVDVAPTPSGDGAREWVLAPARVLAPGESWPLEVVFAPTVEDDALAEMTVLTSDTDRPGGPPRAFLRGNQARPCARFLPPELDFGSLQAGEQKTLDVKIESCGSMPLEIRGLAPDAAAAAAGVALDLSGLPGGAAPTDEAPVTLPGGGSATVKATWSPANPSLSGTPLGGRLVLTGNQFFGATFLPLQGTAFQAFCTQPGIRLVGADTVPLNAVLQASGDASVGHFGTVSSWAWAVTEPAGNDGLLLPSAASRDVSFFAGVPGQYAFRLQVADDAGHPSCGEDVRTVTVTPLLQAAVVATWRPAGGAAPVPGAGPDVDLHLVHPLAPAGDAGWYDSTYDCNAYNNPYPAEILWNNEVEVSAQSADGLGHEVITLEMPGCPQGRVFRFGAHHFEAAGTGPAEVTLTVYINGARALRSAATLAEGDLWDAGTLTCATATAPARADAVPGPRILKAFQPASGPAR